MRERAAAASLLRLQKGFERYIEDVSPNPIVIILSTRIVDLTQAIAETEGVRKVLFTQ